MPRQGDSEAFVELIAEHTIDFECKSLSVSNDGTFTVGVPSLW